jgi:hypothetical protein
MSDLLKHLKKLEIDFSKLPEGNLLLRKRIRALKKSQVNLLYRMIVLEAIFTYCQDDKDLVRCTKSFMYDQDQPLRFWRKLAEELTLQEIVNYFLVRGELR